MTYDQRRIYLTTAGLVGVALAVISAIQGHFGTAAVLAVTGVALVAGAISGHALRQRSNDPSDPRNAD
jgi:hypothetical protein